MRSTILAAVVTSSLVLFLAPSPATAQSSAFPEISDCSYTEGRIELTVTGSTSIKEEVPLNPQASFSSGTTWLQFGVSGAEEPHALITYGCTKEIGIFESALAYKYTP
jgi:hypothetical protein